MPKRRADETKEKIIQLEKRLERYKKRVAPSPPPDSPEHPETQTSEPDPDPEVQEPDLDAESHGDEDLDSEVLSALGETSSGEKGYGEKVHDQIINMIKNILVEGLPKENKQKLLESLLVPINGKLLDAPKLNLELHGVLSNPSKTRDSLLLERQQEMGLAVSGICQVIHNLSKKDFDKINIIKKLGDISRVLSNLHYQYTEIRRKLINPFLDKNLAESLKQNKREAFLYTNLDDSVKSFSAMKRASNVLKPKQNIQVKPLPPKNSQAPQRRPNPNQAHPARGSLRGGAHHRQQGRHPYKPQDNRQAGPSLRGRAKYP